MNRFFLPVLGLIILCFISGYRAFGTDPVKSYTAARVTKDPPRTDGDLSDKAWELVSWGGGDFRQNNPDPGAPASVQTKFKILYDDKNLYIAIKNLDPDPSLIVSRMSRRDGFEGDFCEVNIDSYFDKRTAFSFTASVSGVKGDELVTNDGNSWDSNWDPIWFLATKIVNDGWVAEMRIPLSQLRFADKEEHVWGIQFTRRFFRNQERSNWQYIPPDASGWVHLFGELHGISGIKPQQQLEIQPYVLGKAERFDREDGNPFLTGKSSSLDFGVDAKFGLTSDITLDVSVNPDFGQVEADPSQVNLSAFRLFFPERRPFFIEGNNTLNFPVNDFSNNNLFYSRRIGRPPQGRAYTDSDNEDDTIDEHVRSNPNTTIIGAAKLTGKNRNGFSWGILESVTAREFAEIDSLGFRRKVETEPLTNYFVARGQQDINKGNTVVGGMITATNRDFSSDSLRGLHKSAYSAGVDLMHSWQERKYYVSLRSVISKVLGSKESVLNTQLASERFFQRPDNTYSEVDPSRTSLTGTGGTIVFGKQSGKLVYEAGFNWLSPGLELNDIGFLSQTDQLTQWVWMQYRLLKPVMIFRSLRYNASQWGGWDFSRNRISNGYEVNGNMQFNNFWSFRSGATLTTRNTSNADLRGGPSLVYPGSISGFVSLGSDDRKKLSATAQPRWRRGFSGYYSSSGLDLHLRYRPFDALSMVLAPGISKSRNDLQYVTTEKAENENRYIVGTINQTVARLTVRMTYMLTPNLSLQYWGQPFGSSGQYSEFKTITNGRAADYHQRFLPFPATSLIPNENEILIDENHDGAADLSFGRPDFNFGEFRSNMVLRWEYIPGSTVFLVWTQQVTGNFSDEAGAVIRKYRFDFDNTPHNIFLLKYTYRLVL